MLPAQLTFAASLTCAGTLTNPRCQPNLRCKPSLLTQPNLLRCTPNYKHAQLNDMPLDLSHLDSQVQRQRRPHAMHSTCALSLPETILAFTTRHGKAPP